MLTCNCFAPSALSWKAHNDAFVQATSSPRKPQRWSRSILCGPTKQAATSALQQKFTTRAGGSAAARVGEDGEVWREKLELSPFCILPSILCKHKRPRVDARRHAAGRLLSRRRSDSGGRMQNDGFPYCRSSARCRDDL
eukprot:1194926-Prorocentrum_minimum.AAC.12